MQKFSGSISGLSREELDLDATITSGQVFRWTRDAADGCWTGGIEGGHRLRLAPSGANGPAILYWEIVGELADLPAAETAVRCFLRLDDLRLAESAEEWSRTDPHFAEAWRRQPGVRVLRQDPEECFFSFLCASVAPIARISSMLRHLSEECAGDAFGPFPSTDCIADTAEERLRELGLGFRARRVILAAQRLTNDLPSGYLKSLRERTHEEAKQELIGFAGVGEKIADCVCLFSLDKDGAIPVDTHIWQMARAWYLPDLAGRSLTPAAYARVGSAFRDRFGPFAGWAQQTLFYQAAVGSRGNSRRSDS